MSVTTVSKCGSCGADLVPNTSFCRRCGSATTEVIGSEQPTAMLGVADAATTQPLRARVTGQAVRSTAKTSSRRSVLIAVAILLMFIGAIGAVQFVRTRNQRATVEANQFMYPGARTVLDFKEEGGPRTLHLQTSDSLEQVQSWYQTNLKMSKTTRLTASSYVMKADRSMITLVFEDGTTNIFIKTGP